MTAQRSGEFMRSGAGKAYNNAQVKEMAVSQLFSVAEILARPTMCKVKFAGWLRKQTILFQHRNYKVQCSSILVSTY